MLTGSLDDALVKKTPSSYLPKDVREEPVAKHLDDESGLRLVDDVAVELVRGAG
jgi:hypothetical protein